MTEGLSGLDIERDDELQIRAILIDTS